MILKEIQLFQGIDYDVMEKLAEISTEEEYEKGMVLFNRGDQAEALYILVQGSLNLIIQNGGTITFSLTEPGEVFGWSSMAEHGYYTASGVCSTALKAIKIDRNQLDKLFDNHPKEGLKILRRLTSVVANRLSNVYNDLLSALSTDEIFKD